MIAPLLVALLLAALPEPSQRPRKPGAEGAQATKPDPAFEAVDGAYQSAKITFDQQRLEAGRGRGPAPEGHPARTFWSRMEEVASAGSSRARRWLCENVEFGVVDPTQRGAVLETQLEALLTCCPDDTALFGVIHGARGQSAEIGVERSRALLERIVEKSTAPEIQARALVEEAFVVSERGRTQDPAKIAAARELRLQAVLAFPRTKAAIEAADALLPAVQASFLEAERAWVEQASELQTKGRPAAEWPAQPMHAFRGQFEPLALAGHHAAKKWIELLHPAYVQSEKLGPGLAISALVRDLGAQYPLSNPEWSDVRMRMLALVLREFPADAWVPGALGFVTEDLKQRKMAPLLALPVAQAVQERSDSVELRAIAAWIEAETRCAEGSEAQFDQALAALDRIQAAPGGLIGLEQQAAERAAAIRRVMPGSPLPDSRTSEWAVKDGDEQELVMAGYRGRVILIDVFDVQDAEWVALVPSRRELQRELEGKPFDLVGLCSTRLSKSVWDKTLASASIDWRCGALQGWQHPYVTMLMAIHRPSTTILVDADGVIRARDRSWDEMARLARELVAKAPPAPGASGAK